MAYAQMESKKVARFLLKFKLYTHIKSNEVDEIVNLIDKCGLEYDYFDDRITFLTLGVIQETIKNFFTEGDDDIVQILVNAGTNVNLLSHVCYKWHDEKLFCNFESALITATREGLYNICKILLNSNANVNKTDSFQMTAMHWACELNHVDIVDLLVAHQARIDFEDIKGHTPIDLCILKDNKEAFNYLIDHVDIKFCYYKLLFAAVENFNHEMLRILLNKQKQCDMDFDINTVDNTVGSLLHYAVILSNFDSNGFQKCISSDNYLNTIEVLLDNGVEVNLINKLGETPLHLCRNCLIVDLLLSHGAQMNVKEVTGKTPLFTYFCRANYDMCLELLKHGSDLEIIDRFGNSLFYAVIHSNAPIHFIKLLLDAGVCLNNERWFIEKLFPLRLKKKYPKVISFLEWRSRNPLSLKEQCRKNIRTYLNHVNRNTSVLNRVQNLPVPLCLQDYILFNLK